MNISKRKVGRLLANYWLKTLKKIERGNSNFCGTLNDPDLKRKIAALLGKNKKGCFVKKQELRDGISQSA